MITACHSCALNNLGETLSLLSKTEPFAKDSCDFVASIVRRRCVKCMRAGRDDIRLSHSPHAVEAAVETPPASTPPASVTPLDEGAEDAARLFVAKVLDLSPLQVLLIYHVMRGGSLASFGPSLKKVSRRIELHRGFSRARAWDMKEAIVRAIPSMAKLLNDFDKFFPKRRASSRAASKKFGAAKTSAARRRKTAKPSPKGGGVIGSARRGKQAPTPSKCAK